MGSNCLFVILAILVGVTAGQIVFDIYKERATSAERFKRGLPYSLTEPPINDSVVLYKYLNGEYYGLIGVGSPAKTFKVIFDTTWADSWLPSSHCAWTEIVCKLHTQYDSSASSSYVPNNAFVNLTSSDLSLMGLLSTDTFILPHVKVRNQTFIEATHISVQPFIQYRADGIIGLAYEDQSDLPGVIGFFYNLIRQQVIKEQVFTFYMNRDETTGKAGKVIFGGRQRKHVRNGTLTRLEVVERRLWQIQVDSIYATKNKTDYPISGKVNAIFDSSANTIIGPPADIQKLNYMLNAVFVPGLNRYTVNCRQYAKLPTVHFTLNGNDFSIQSKYYVQRLTLENIEACFSPFVPASTDKPAFWELGGAFMMEFYTEFDMGQNSINIGETVF